VRFKFNMCVRVCMLPRRGFPRQATAHGPTRLHGCNAIYSKGQNDETCDILVPNELKNEEHLGPTV